MSADGADKGFDAPTEARWQSAIYELCKKAVGPENDSLIDGGGCDSGDALDFTLVEIWQAIRFWQDKAESAPASGAVEWQREAIDRISGSAQTDWVQWAVGILAEKHARCCPHARIAEALRLALQAITITLEWERLLYPVAPDTLASYRCSSVHERLSHAKDVAESALASQGPRAAAPDDIAVLDTLRPLCGGDPRWDKGFMTGVKAAKSALKAAREGRDESALASAARPPQVTSEDLCTGCSNGISRCTCGINSGMASPGSGNAAKYCRVFQPPTRAWNNPRCPEHATAKGGKVMACEKCWGDAFLRMLVNGKEQAENYCELLEERKGNPCTPEEERGEVAGLSSCCSREEAMTRYQFVWYGFHWRNWLRLFYQVGGKLCRVYKYRVAVGPVDIRKWKEKP